MLPVVYYSLFPLLQHLPKIEAIALEPKLIKSSRETVTLLAKLKGMGCEAQCVVSAVKLSLPEFGITQFVGCDVVQAPSELPDGEYIVNLQGRELLVEKRNHVWHHGGV